jgi:hypothetical protein
MEIQRKHWKKLLTVITLLIALFIISVNCITRDLLMGMVNEGGTQTYVARDTEWAATSTEFARRYNFATATSEQATQISARLTQESDLATYEVQQRSLTQTAEAPKPPVITGINFPKEIPGNKSTMIGLLYFKDADGDLRYAQYDVVSATNFGSGTDDKLNLDSGDWYDGAIKIYLWCEGQQTVTLSATLYDWAGNQSNSMSFTFTCK